MNADRIEAGEIGKAELRTRAKAVRTRIFADLSPAARCAAAFLLAERVEAMIDDSATVSAYLPIGSEIDTIPLLDRLARRGIRLALPHVPSRTGAMRFLSWSPGDRLPAGPMGIRQPDGAAAEVEPDVIVTPLLAFDARGNRLGYGAGHFDRAFARLPRARRIGVGWSGQRVDDVPVDAWDMPLHAVATDTDLVSGLVSA